MVLSRNQALAVGELGLTNVRPESPGVVLIGRRSGNQIIVHTYDWLLEQLQAGLTASGVGNPLKWQGILRRDGPTKDWAPDLSTLLATPPAEMGPV